MKLSAPASLSVRLLPAVLLLAAVAASAARAEERIVQRDFAVQPGATLKIDTYRGSVDVRDSPDGKIHVAIHMDPGTDGRDEADKILQRLQLDVRQDGAVVSIVARNPAETRVRFVWEDKQKISLAYGVRVPRDCNLDIATRDGGVSVDALGSIAGRMTVRATKGTVFLRNIDGDILAAVDSGDLVVGRCSGSVDLKVYVGNIRVGTVTGPATLQSTNGDIELQHGLDAVKATAEAGEISVGLPRTFGRDSTIKTNGGGITVRMDPGAHCSLQASSVWGHVHTTLPFVPESGGDDKRTLVGRLNGGGALLTLHADGGQVRIEAPRI